MVRNSLRVVLFSLVTLAVAAPAFAYNVVNTSWTVTCLFSTTCSVTVNDYVYAFPVSGGSGNGELQSRVFQGQPGSTAAGKWVYEYRLIMTDVAGIGYPPYINRLAIYNFGTIRQYDYNSNGVATDHVFNVTSGGLGSRAVTASYVSAGWTYFDSQAVYAGSFPGDGESSYFFGVVSDAAPVVRAMWVNTDSGWVLVQGYAPPQP